jgi:hypothetical protein
MKRWRSLARRHSEAAAPSRAGFRRPPGPNNAAPTAVLGAPHFVEETASAVNHVYDGGKFRRGRGIAAFDCNADGKPDSMSPGGRAGRRLPQ